MIEDSLKARRDGLIERGREDSRRGCCEKASEMRCFPEDHLARPLAMAIKQGNQRRDTVVYCLDQWKVDIARRLIKLGGLMPFGEPPVVVTDKLRSYTRPVQTLAPQADHRAHTVRILIPPSKSRCFQPLD